jgi:hypothetical protein
MKMKIYYAHSMSLYDTPQEKRDVELLETLGFNVINPNSKEIQDQVDSIKGWCAEAGKTRDETSSEIMLMFFQGVIPFCDALAFRSFHDGKIGAGVWSEIVCAQNRFIPIIELPNIISYRKMDIEETREILKLIGYR